MIEIGVSAKHQDSILSFPDMSTVALRDGSFSVRPGLFGIKLKPLVDVPFESIREVHILTQVTGSDLLVLFRDNLQKPVRFRPSRPDLWVAAFSELGITIVGQERRSQLNRFSNWYFKGLAVVGALFASLCVVVMLLLWLRSR